jgi:hypothetical protein
VCLFLYHPTLLGTKLNSVALARGFRTRTSRNEDGVLRNSIQIYYCWSMICLRLV